MKDWIKKYYPDPNSITEDKRLRFFGKAFKDPNLWHLNRRSVSGAFAVGLFCAFVPIPFQMFLATAVAIWVRVNLPISIALVWITNPITMPVLYYFTYLVGTWVLGAPATETNFEVSMAWLGEELSLIWQPFVLGCFITSTVSAIIGYFGIRLLWRWNVLSRRAKRQKTSPQQLK